MKRSIVVTTLAVNAIQIRRRSQLMVEKRTGNRGARQQSLSRRTAKAVFALKRSGSPCSFLVPFASKTRLTFSRDVGEKPSPYLNGIDPCGRHGVGRASWRGAGVMRGEAFIIA